MNSGNYGYYIYAALGFTIICLGISLISAMLQRHKTLETLKTFKTLKTFNTIQNSNFT